MKIPQIKAAVEQYTIQQLEKAEQDLLEEKPLEIEVQGEDEGEVLTHIMAALWIKKNMEEEQQDFRQSCRTYTTRVRNSIN